MSEESRVPPEIMQALRQIGMPERIPSQRSPTAIAKWLVNEDREFNVLLVERDSLRAEVERLKHMRHSAEDHDCMEMEEVVQRLKAQLAEAEVQRMNWRRTAQLAGDRCLSAEARLAALREALETGGEECSCATGAALAGTVDVCPRCFRDMPADTPPRPPQGETGGEGE